LADLPPDDTRALSFALLVLGNLGLVLASRTPAREMSADAQSGNRALRIIVALTVLGLISVLTIPALRELFHFGTPPLVWWLLVLALGTTLLPLLFGSRRARL
jgi:Cation transporting ATPase, C-terminus